MITSAGWIRWCRTWRKLLPGNPNRTRMGFDFQLMLYPLLACLLLPGILVYLGVHIVRREIIFVDLALAQVAALGTSVCLMLGHDAHDLHTYLWSLGFTFLGALIFALTRNHGTHRVPQE